MTKIEIQQLNESQTELIKLAMDVRERAYAPYSKFKVGAAIRDVSGAIHTGCNIESVDFTLTSHAEMVAIDSMVKSGVHELTELVVCVKSTAVPVPCGLCRQKMLEFRGADNVSIICVNLNNEDEISEIFVSTLDELMPYGFTKEALK